jgi:hypothetical protein
VGQEAIETDVSENDEKRGDVSMSELENIGEEQ